MKARGLDAFHRDILELAAFFADRVNEMDDWAKVKLLSVARGPA